MKKIIPNLVLILISFAVISCKDNLKKKPGDILFIGRSSNGGRVKHYFSHLFEKKMSKAFSETSSELIYAFDEKTFSNKNNLKLKRITVGLALEAELDLAVVELESSGVFELRFEK